MPRLMLLSVFCLCTAAFADGVRVSERFGFDQADSTRFVQQAIDSGLPEIVLDRKASPWVVTPLKPRSGMRLVFEDGAEMVAKEGAFRDTHDMVFRMQFLTNVTIIGRGPRGGTIRMRKPDYQGGQYAVSEWRHAIWLLRCKNVLVENMTISSSGGDGIEVSGNSEDVTIRRVTCDDNHRQGISVLSAKNLLIEDCVLKSTSGTPPMAGIDWEPDAASDALINCVMRRCRVENNSGNGIEFYFGRSTGKTPPIDVLVEDCRVIGCNNSASVGGGVYRKPSHPRGCVTYRRCSFEGPRNSGISVRSKPSDAFRLVFEDCVISNAQGKSDIAIGTDRWDQEVGGVEFPGLRTFRNRAGTKFGTSGLGTLPPKSLPPRSDFPSEDSVETVDLRPGEMVKLSAAIVQERAPYVFFAERAGKVRFRARQILRGRSGCASQSPIRVSRMILPSRPNWNVEVASPGLEGGLVEMDVPGRGFYFMSGPMSGATRFLLEEADVPVGINISTKSPLIIPQNAAKPLRFWIPVAAKSEFAVLMAGCDADCAAKMSVYGPDGALKGDADSVHNWTAVKVSPEDAGLYLLEISKPTKGFYFAFQFDLVGAPGMLLLSDEKHLRRKQSGLSLVAPRDGEVVKLLTDRQLEFMALSEPEREKYFDDGNSEARKEIKSIRWFPRPVVLRWDGEGPFEVSVTKRGAEKPFHFERTDGKDVKVWNLEIAADYDWKVVSRNGSARGSFRTADNAPRLIRIPSEGDCRGVFNFRDMGGRIVKGGRRVRQGLVYRSSGFDNSWFFRVVEERGLPRLDEKWRSYLTDTLGIRTDIDLRSEAERGKTKVSPLGESVRLVCDWENYYGYASVHSRGLEATKKIFRLMTDRANYPMVFHCAGGADRTGTVASLLHGILGLSDEEILLDYQVTAWWGGVNDAKHLGWFRSFVRSFDKFEGDTLSERICEYFRKSCGFTEEELNAIRGILLEK